MERKQEHNAFNTNKHFFAPVYVKRTSIDSRFLSSSSSPIKESFTQTSKTIIELAKLETGLISPDSLNNTPRPKLELENGRFAVDLLNNKLKRATISSENALNRIKDEYTSDNVAGDITENDDNKVKPVSKREPERNNDVEEFMYQTDGQVKDDRDGYYPQSAPNYRDVTDYSTVCEDSYKESDTTTSTPQQKKYEVWNAQVVRKTPAEMDNPVVVNLVEKQQSSLIDQYLTQKQMRQKPKRNRSPFYLQQKRSPNTPNSNPFKSNSCIEPRKTEDYPSPPTRRKQYRKQQFDYSNVSPKIGDCEFNRRSNSFMSPTLASAQKSLRQEVDGVKNLVSMTCKGRSSKTNIKMVKSEEIARTNNQTEPEMFCPKLHLNSSTTTVLGSTASSDNGLFIILSHIKSPDWNFALKGLAEIIDLARNGDPDMFMPFMTVVNQRMLELLKSPRSHVCRTACQIAGHFFETMKDTRRPEFDDIVNVLLYKTADASKFIRQDANLALDCMVTHIPTFHAIRALCAKGPSHRNYLVRCASIRLLICAVVIAGPSILLNNPSYEHSRKRVIINLAHFLDDKNHDTRKYAERLYKILTKESSFEFYLKKYLDRQTLDSFYRTLRFIKK